MARQRGERLPYKGVERTSRGRPTNANPLARPDALGVKTGRPQRQQLASSPMPLLKTAPAVILIDLNLPSGPSGMEVLRRLASEGLVRKIVVWTGLENDETQAEAKRLGIAHHAAKPSIGELLNALGKTAARTTVSQDSREGDDPHAPVAAISEPLVSCVFVGPLAERIARAIVQIVEYDHDVRTLHQWGRSVGASRGAIRDWCFTVGIQPKAALALARALRAFWLAQRFHQPPADFLEFHDPRTVAHFLKCVSFPETPPNVAPAWIELFCRSQGYVRHSGILAAVTRVFVAAVPDGHKP